MMEHYRVHLQVGQFERIYLNSSFQLIHLFIPDVFQTTNGSFLRNSTYFLRWLLSQNIGCQLVPPVCIADSPHLSYFEKPLRLKIKKCSGTMAVIMYTHFCLVTYKLVN